jgi:aspartate aminotransferase
MAASAVAFHLLVNADEEAIFSTPSWFLYEPMLRAADAVPKKVKLRGERFDINLSAIKEAISPQTHLVVINTPHNPTGNIYRRDQLVALAGLLNRAPSVSDGASSSSPINPIAVSGSTDMTSSVQQRSSRGP